MPCSDLARIVIDPHGTRAVIHSPFTVRKIVVGYRRSLHADNHRAPLFSLCGPPEVTGFHHLNGRCVKTSVQDFDGLRNEQFSHVGWTCGILSDVSRRPHVIPFIEHRECRAVGIVRKNGAPRPAVNILIDELNTGTSIAETRRHGDDPFDGYRVPGHIGKIRLLIRASFYEITM